METSQKEIVEHIINFIRQRDGNEALQLDCNTDLFESGALDSFGIIELLSSLGEQFSIEIDFEDLSLLESSSIAEFAQKLQ